MTKQTAATTIANAKVHAHKASMRSSADLCIATAEECFANGKLQYALIGLSGHLDTAQQCFTPVKSHCSGAHSKLIFLFVTTNERRGHNVRDTQGLRNHRL